MMKTLRGVNTQEITCLDEKFNIFKATLSDGRTVVFRQPRRHDIHEQRVAWKKISEPNKRRYRRVNIEEPLYDMKKRCQMPLYAGEFPGVLPLTIEVEGEVVGFSDIFFKMGTDFERFKVDPTDKCANGSIIALDKFHGMGIGSIYSEMSDYISRHYGCQFILGRTFLKNGMRGIRSHDDWEVIWTDGTMVDHRKRL